MRVCCVDLNIAARLIGFYGLVVGAIVMVEMSTELGRIQCSKHTLSEEGNGEEVPGVQDEEMSPGAAISAWLLGLSLDEFGSRMRHSMHAGDDMAHAPHVHVHSTPQDPAHFHVHKPSTTTPVRNQTLELAVMEAENQIYIGFLVFAMAYASASALLIYGSVAEVRWTAVPWLIAHLGTVSAQTAGLVVQFTAATVKVRDGDRSAPDHPEGTHLHEADHADRASPGAIVLSVTNMVFLVYMWIVVIVAVRPWGKKNLMMSTRAAPGDESFALSAIGSSSPYYH